MSKVMFTVRREYFDAIVAGTKQYEYRGTKRWGWLLRKGPTIAVFVCGRRVHRRAIIGIWVVDSDEDPAVGTPDVRYVETQYPGESIIAVRLGRVWGED